MNLFSNLRKSTLTEFRKDLSIRNALLNMIKNWKQAFHKSEKVDTLFIDQSRAFDTLIIIFTCQTKCVWFFYKCDKICTNKKPYTAG